MRERRRIRRQGVHTSQLRPPATHILRICTRMQCTERWQWIAKEPVRGRQAEDIEPQVEQPSPQAQPIERGTPAHILTLASVAPARSREQWDARWWHHVHERPVAVQLNDRLDGLDDKAAKTGGRNRASERQERRQPVWDEHGGHHRAIERAFGRRRAHVYCTSPGPGSCPLRIAVRGRSPRGRDPQR